MLTPIISVILLLLALLMLFPLGKHYWQRHRRKTTYRFILDTINSLYANTNPFQIAKNAQQQLTAPNTELLYGEIDLVTLLDLVAKLQPNANDVFYDLGSGCGKTLLAVKLCYPNLTVNGIEQGFELHTLALEKYNKYLANSTLASPATPIIHIHENFVHFPFSDATIIFINATAYEATWQQILDKLSLLKPGTKIIITSKTLPNDNFTPLYQGMELMSWGLTSTYIYLRK